MLIFSPLSVEFQNQPHSLRSNLRARLRPCWFPLRVLSPQPLLLCFPRWPSLISLRTLQRDKALRGLASSKCADAAARHEGLAEILVHGRMEGLRRIAAALRHNRTSTLSAPRPFRRNRSLPAGRSAHRRCSVDCGVPQTSLQNRASLRGIIFEASACFWIARVSAQSTV